ncbi:hypothetical protein GCM10023196_097350 [Actinoallomurus vinaceus]|uniref:Uncharacterized protein n=1 Tax=Actinoallomurus vinaceus TaxID=1080074 RepID=A0ABP8UVZ7_9ACTN
MAGRRGEDECPGSLRRASEPVGEPEGEQRALAVAHHDEATPVHLALAREGPVGVQRLLRVEVEVDWDGSPAE